MMLKNLGFTEKEEQLYLTTLELGMAPISVIAQKANIKRPTAYEILDRLAKKGVAEYFLKKNVRFYSVISPQALFEKYKSHLGDFEKELPKLKAIDNRIVHKPKVRFFEGKENLQKIYLEALQSKNTIYNYFLAEQSFGYLSEAWFDEHWFPFVRNIDIKVIAADSPMARRLRNWTAHGGRQAKIWPNTRPKLKNEIYIYDNRVVTFSFDEDFALMVESEDVANTQKEIFDIAWSSKDLILPEKDKLYP